MNKIISISLLLIFLSVNTELHQLVRLPVLIHHFLEHHDDDHSQSFADFLWDHYLCDQNHSDSDHHDHDNLPFKTNDCASLHNSIALVHHYIIPMTETNIFVEKVSIAYNEINCSSAMHNKIWQPPQAS